MSELPLAHHRYSPASKITLFRSLFRGREDVYARRFESRTTGRSGYQPACANEGVRDVCEKPKLRCRDTTDLTKRRRDERITLWFSLRPWANNVFALTNARSRAMILKDTRKRPAELAGGQLCVEAGDFGLGEARG